jgi:DNA polymerase-3 subunit epsilon
VGLCALLCDHTGAILQCHDVLIRPDGWVSTEGALAVHGITHERAMDEGIPERDAVELLLGCTARSSRMVAHNIGFDHKIIEIALARYFDVEHMRHWREDVEPYCTLQAAKRLLNLSSNKLGDVYRHLFGCEIAGRQHDALFDTFAMRRVYLELQRREAMAAVTAAMPVERPSRVFMREAVIPPDVAMAAMLQPAMAPIFEN